MRMIPTAELTMAASHAGTGLTFYFGVGNF
jgi:hypothetical protein